MAKTSKKLHWWLFALLTFVVFVLLQVPAAWLIAKFYKNNQSLHNVSGNIWQGQADWKQGQLRGTLTWSSRPLDLLLLRVAAQVQIDSGQTHVQGKVAYGLAKTLHIQQLNGEIAASTLQQLTQWQWPSSSIRLQEINLKYQKQHGFAAADGQLHWQGGNLQVPFSGRQERIDVPALQAQLKDQQNQLLLDVRDQREQKMLNAGLDANLMLDLQLTQRFLLNNPNYQGQAAMDSYVLSTRQPLLRGAL